MLVLIAFWQIAQPLQAATVYWDTDGSIVTNDSAVGTGLGGTGNWDLATSNWWDLSSLGLWPNTSDDIAIFGGPFSILPTLRTVTLSSGIMANQLQFYRSGYTLTGGDLTLAGTTPALHANLGESATIDSQILGSAGLTKTGGGSIRLSNNTNAYTGVTTIRNGSLVITNQSALGASSSPIVVAAFNPYVGASSLGVNNLRGFGSGSLVLDGTGGNITISRDLSLQGRGPVGDNGAALISTGVNTLSGTVDMGVLFSGTNMNTRIIAADGTLNITGTLNVLGVAATTINTLGGVNQAGASFYDVSGVLTGSGTLEKSGGGTLFLNPSDSSGFSGTIRVSGSAASGQSVVRIDSPGVLGSRTSGTTGAVLDLNGGILAVLMDTPDVKVSNGTNANVYFRAASTIFADHTPGSSAKDQTVAFGNMSFEDNITLTFNSRNGYGMSFTTAPVNGGNEQSTFTNNLQGGALLSFTGNFWSNTDNGAARTMNIGGNGNTLINGNIIATSVAFNHNLTKTGTGTLTLTGTGSTLDGNVNVNGGTVAINDFRAITNNTSNINIGTTTTGATFSIVGNNATLANLTTSKVFNLAGTTGGATILANQTGTSPGVVLNADFTATGGTAANAKTVTLGGTNIGANTINGIIPNNAAGGLVNVTKIDAGRWILADTNTYTGATTISNGTLQLKANAASSTIVADTSAIVFNATNVYAGGTLELVGQSSTNNVETLGALTPTAGSGTVRLTPGSGGTASIVFASLGTVGGGGTVNIDAPTSSDTVKFTTTAITNNIANAGLYYNGSDFAFVPGAATALRAPNYTTDTDFATTSTALTSARSMEITGAGFSNAAVTIDSLRINGATALNMTGLLTIRTAGTANATGGIIQTGGSGSITGTGVSTGGSGALVINVDGGANSLSLDAPITATTTGGFTKVGAGTLRLGGTNAQTGTITINEGTVRLAGADRLGAAAALTIRQDGILELNGVTPATSTNAFNNNGIVRNTSATTDVTFTVGGANGTGTSLGIIEDGGVGKVSVVKLGTGGQSWLGLSTYTGSTTIGSTGIVTINNLQNGGSASGIGASSNAASNLIFNGDSTTQAYGGLSYTGTTNDSTDRLFTFNGGADGGVRIQSNGVNGATSSWTNTGALAFGANATGNPQGLVLGGASTGDNRFFPIINDNGAAVTSVYKADAGVWYLEATNGYSGATTLTAGTLYADSGTSLPTASNLVFNGGNFATTGSFSRTIGTGSGQMQWGAAASGGFSAGGSPLTVDWGSGNVWGTTAGFLGTGALLLNNSGVAKSDVTILSGFDLGGGTRTVTVGDFTSIGADFATLSGAIIGSGSLAKNGAGILNLRGANTYTGNTAVTQGTLVVTSLGSSASLANTATSVGVSGNTTTFDNSNSINLGNGTTTGGILEYVGLGETSDRKIRLNTTTGTNQIHADGVGALILTNMANDMTAGAKSLSLRGVNASGNMITSQLSDNGGALSISVDSSATWILTNNNNYTGGTSVTGGALGIGHDNALGDGTGTLTISNGTVFAYGGDRTISNPITQSATSGTIAGFSGDYSLTLTGLWSDPSTTSTTRAIRNNIVSGKTLTLAGEYRATVGTTSRFITFDGSGDTILSGAFTVVSNLDFGLAYAGTGSLTLSNSGNSYTGRTTITSGTVKLGASEVIPNGAVNPANNVVIMDPGLGLTATLDLNGKNETINGLTMNTDGTAVIDNTSATAASLTFGANDQAVSIGGVGTYTIQNSGGGALSITKTGSAAATIPTGVNLNYTGTTNVSGGSLTIASALNGTTALSVTNSGSALALSGGITTPAAITSVVVENGATLSLLDGAGNQLSMLTNLQLGSTGGTMTTLNLNVGDITNPDMLATDTLTLLTGGTLSLFAGNQITLNLTDAGLNGNSTYNLIDVTDGGLILVADGGTGTTLGIADWILGATPGGFSSVTLNRTDTLISITTGNLITGTSYWRGALGGGTDTTWNGNANNWSTDKAGTIAAGSTPGSGTDVVFQWDAPSNAAVVTTLEQNFKINSLTFEDATVVANTATSITIDPGLLTPTARLEIAPQVSTDGIKVLTTNATTATISGAVKLGGTVASQTWEVSNAGSVLSIGSLFGEKDVTKTGAGKVTLTAAADPTFNSGVTADFIINAGTFEILNSAALGNTINSNLATVTVNSTGAFYYNGVTGTVANNLTLNGGTLSAGTGNQTYNGTVNVSGNSFINMADSNGPASNTARNITLSGLVSGTGSLTIDSNNTVSSGNQTGGTLTLNNVGNTWSGDLIFNEGTVLLTSAATPGFTANDVTFNTFGRLQLQGVSGQTLNRSGTLNFAGGALAEFSVDTTGTVTTDFIVNQNGAVTLGSGGNGATVRVFAADTEAKLNIVGGVTLGGNSSISVAANAARLLTIDGVIDDGASSYSLAINDDAGGWAQTNGIVHLTSANTYDGGTNLANGILRLGNKAALGTGTMTVTGTSTVQASTNLTGANKVSNAFSIGAFTLTFSGAESLEIGGAGTLTGAPTLSANGTGGATITYSGAIDAAANSFTLTGAAGSGGFITGGITQTGDAADATVSGGTWTHTTGTSRVGDELTITGANTILNLNSGLFQVRDEVYVVSGANLNLNGTDVLSFNTPTVTSGTLRAYTGGIITLGANEAVVSTEFDELRIGVDGTGIGTFNMGTFTQTTTALLLGNRNLDREGIINGTGTLTVASGGNIDLYEGTINANLASSGSTTLDKFGLETVTLSGDNSGLAGTGATVIDEGTLLLDYTTSNTVKIRAASQLSMVGSNLILNGNASAATAQSVGSFTLGSGGNSFITLNPGASQEVVLNLNAITRAVNAQDGTIRFNLPTGTQSATNGITTDTLNTLGTGGNAILGGWATVNDGTGVFFARNATNAVDGNIVAAATTVQDAVGSWLSGENISDSTGFTGTVTAVNLNSLRFNAVAGSDLVVANGGILGITSGGILVTSNVGATPSLTGGTIASGAVASNVPELIITQDSASTFEMGADIRINHAVTKSGAGTLLLTGNNVYTGYTEVQNGTLQLSGGNAIGDTSLVTLAANRNSTLQLLADETIGRLQGGLRADGADLGMVDVGAFTLSINESAGTTYSGRFNGSGTIVLNAGSTGNLNYAGQTSTGLFTGSVIVNGGLFQLSGATARLGSATSFTINGAGNFLLDNNDDTNVTDRISDTATFTLNSAAGPFSGETRPRGLANRNNDNDNATETYGSLVLNSGASYVSLEASGGTSAQAGLTAAVGWTRNNNATVNVRGRNLGGTSAERAQFKVADANDAAMLAANIGGGGVIGGTAKNVSIIPWAIGEALTTTLADGNMGNTFLSYVDNRGFVPLILTDEYSTFGTAAATDNVRESLGADLTGIFGATINSLVVNNTAFAGLDVTGSGAGQALAITSGAMLFTVTGGADSTAYDTTLGGFDSGITVGGTNEYVIHVVNPSSATTTSTLTATISSPLTTAADITKSGRGTLILSGSNTAGGGSNKTTLNEGLLEISDLDNIGGDTGALVFAGGGLRFGAGLTDDISLRTISFLVGGATLDTNGIDLALANSLGSGAGGFTKTGAGNLTLNAAATYTGNSVLSLGTITVGANNALGNGGNLTLAGGTTLALGTNSLTHGLVTTSGASPAITGTGTITASTGFFLNHTGDTTIDAILAGSGGLLKAQANVVTLTGASTYTGTTEIQNGTLSINSISNVGGGASALGNAANAENGIIRMGLTTAATTLQYTGSGHTSDRFIGMQGTTGGVTLDADGTGALVLGGVQGEMAGAKTLTLQGSSAGNLINSIGSIADGAGTLSVAKTEANTWALTGPSTYTGTTTVSQGTLLVNNTTGSGTGSGLTTVNGGTSTQGTLGGTGIITGGVTLATNGATSFAQGAVLNPGSVGTAGTLTINTTALTTNNFSNLSFDLDTAITVGGGVNDLISTNIIPVFNSPTQVNINTLGTLTGGFYTLINGYTGTIGTFDNIGVNTIFTGVDTARSGFLVNEANQLRIFITGATPTTAYWSGANNGFWDNFDTGGSPSTNWRTDATGNVDTLALPGVTTDVFFNTTTPTAANLTTTLGQNLTIKTLNFTADADSPVSISGSTLTITPGSGSTGITIASGAAGAVTINSNIALGASQTWTVTDGGSILDVSGSISGPTFGITKAGAGTLTLSGTNTFDGGVILNAGTLNINSAAALGATAGTFVINGGVIDNTSGLAVVSSTNNAQTWSADITFTGSNSLDLGTGIVTLGADRTVTVSANKLTIQQLTGAFALTKEGAGTFETGAATDYSGVTTINAGFLQGTTTNNLSAASAHVINAGGTLRLNDSSQTIGSLAGSGTVENNGGTTADTLTVGGNNSSTVFSGILQDGAAGILALTKVGNGTLTLSGNYSSSTLTGTVLVSGGVLQTTGTFDNVDGITFGATNIGISASTKGMLYVASGTYTTGTTTIGADSAGETNSGSLVVNGGAYSTSGRNINLGGNTTNAGYNALVLQSGSINTAYLDFRSTSTDSVGSLRIDGGTLTDTDYLLFRDGHFEFTVTGGTFDKSASINNIALGYSTSGVGTMTVTGGLVDNTGHDITVRQSANNPVVSINLNGGQVITNSILVTSAAGTGTLNFNGGTLTPGSNGGTLVANTVTTAYVNAAFGTFAGGAVIDTAGNNTTIAEALLAPAGKGVAGLSLTTAGSGYIGPPVLEITTTAGPGSGATGYATVDLDPTSGTFGQITGVVLTNPGVGYDGTSTFAVNVFGGGGSGATFDVTGITGTDLISGGLTKNGAGILTLSGINTYTGATTINAGTVALGVANSLSDSTTVTIAGGTFDVASFNDTVATVSLQSGGISGSTGVLTSSANYDLRSGTVDFTGAGGLAGAVGLDKTTGGTVTLSGATNVNSFSGAVSVTGGTLSFSTSNHLGNASATNTLSVSGGSTLQFTNVGSVDLGANRVLTIGSGGAILEATQSTGVLTLPSIAGASTGDLTKTGVGSVIIGGTTSLNAGAGAATVSGGKLTASFGTGGINNLTVGATGNMSFQNGAAEALTLSSGVLTLADGARLGFDLGTLGSPGTSDQILTSTAASVAGTITLDFLSISGFGAGTYNLITASSGLDNATYVLGTGISGWKLVPTATSTLVSLAVTPFVPIYWRGGQNFSWDTLGTATANWTTDDAGMLDATSKPTAADTVVFSATGAPFSSGTEITTTLDAAFTIDSLQFTSVPGTISAVTINPGSGGTLTLAPASNVDGIEVQDNAGTITIAAPLTASTSQTWSVSSVGTGNALVVSGDTTFTAAVKKTGTGTLTLSGTNGGAGGFRLTAGTLILGSNNALGTGTFTVDAGVAIDATGGSRTLNNAAYIWNGNFAFTGTSNLDLGSGAVALGGNVGLLASGSILTVGGAIEDGASTFSLTKAGAGTLVLNGANGYDGLTDLLQGALTLGGDNSGAAGGVTMAVSTTLNIGHNNAGTTNALGTGTFTINGGTIDNTSGSAITANGGNNLQNWNGSFIFTGSNNLNLGTGAVTLGANTTVTTTANTLTAGAVTDGASTFNLTKAGAGTLVLGGVSTYDGSTTIGQGTLKFTSGTQALTSATNTLVFGATAGSTSLGNLDLSTASATFGGATTVQTNSATANIITIGAGQTLRLDGAVTIGYNSAGVTTTKLNVTGLGTFTIGDSSTATNAAFTIGGNVTTDVSNKATLDLSGLSTFYANLGTGTFRVGDATNGGGGAGTGGGGSTLILAANSTILATTITSDSPTDNVTQVIKLGSGTNVLWANTITIGISSNRTDGTLDFNSGTGTLEVRNLTGTGRAAFNVANGPSGSGALGVSTVDFTGHSANLLLGTLTVGGRSAGTSGGATGTFSFDTGILDATSVVVATRTGTTQTTGNVTGTVTIGGGTSTIGTVTMATNSSSASTTGDATATLNISGGTNTITTLTMGVNTVAGATGNGSNTDATINITGGATTVNTTFTMGAQNSALNAATNVNTAISTLNISAGSLTLAGATNLTMGQATLDAQNAATASINITGTGTLTVGGNIRYTDSALGTESNTITLNGGTLDMDGGTIGGDGTGTNDGTITFNAQSGTLKNLAELNGGGVFVGATLTKTTAGLLTIEGTNTYTGGTAINDGILRVNSTGGNSLGTTGTISFGGGTLQHTANDTTDYSGRFSTAGSQAVSIDTNGQNVTYATALSSTGGTLTKTGGAGILSLTGANTYDGATTVNAGTLQLGTGGTTGSLNAASAVSVGSGATFAVNRSNTVTQGTDFSSAAITGDGAFAQSGSGSTILSAANTYTGGTTVSAGTLEVNNTTGSGTGTGNVNVTYTSGAATKLSGSGSIAGSTILNAGTILAPGEGTSGTSNKTLTFAAATSISAANDAQIQLGVTTADSIDGSFATWFQANPGGTAAQYVASLNSGSGTIADTNWNTGHTGDHDFITAAGTIILGSTSTTDKRVVVSLNSATGLNYGSVFNLLDWTTAGTLDGASLSSMASGNFSMLDNLQLEALTGGLDWDTSLFDSYGILVVVPEPSRALLLMLGLLGLMLRRRRR